MHGYIANVCIREVVMKLCALVFALHVLYFFFFTCDDDCAAAVACNFTQVVVYGRDDGEKGKRVRCFEDEANASTSPAAAGAGAAAAAAAGSDNDTKGGSSRRLGTRLGGVPGAASRASAAGSGGSRPGTAPAPPPEGGMGLAGRGIWPFLAIPLVTPTGGTVRMCWHA